MQNVLIAAGVVLGGLLLALLVLALLSRHGQAPGLLDGRLTPCPASPNCVCSEPGTDVAHAAEPLPLPGGPDPVLSLRDAVMAAGGEVQVAEGDYLAATFRSSLFGFVDDLELRLQPDAGVVQVRSASRVGHSDLGANRRRVEVLRALLARRSPTGGGKTRPDPG
jgi:uncharacterized protein (DUF1499 family)